MKPLFLAAILLTTPVGLCAQSFVIRPLGKWISKAVAHETPEVLSHAASKQFLQSRPAQRALTSTLNEGYVVAKWGNEAYLVRGNTSLLRSRQYDYNAVFRAGRTGSGGSYTVNALPGIPPPGNRAMLRTFEKNETSALQRDLRAKGYKVAETGAMDEATRSAATKAYGYDCSSLSGSAIRRKERELASRYDLRIQKQGKSPEFRKGLTEQEFAQALRKMQETMDCSLGEICADIRGREGNVSIDCKDALGNKVSLNVSSRGRASVSFRTPNNNSMKLSGGADGKLNVTLSDGRRTQEL